MSKLQYKPGDKAKLVVAGKMPHAYEWMLHVRPIIKNLGKIVTIKGRYSTGFTIEEDGTYWYREELFEEYWDDIMDEPVDVEIDYAMFEQLMSE